MCFIKVVDIRKDDNKNMVYEMSLQNEPYMSISSGEKSVELRLFDEKRRKLEIGDKIIFTNLSNEIERLAVEIKALYRYGSFKDLFDEIPKEKCGYLSDTTIEEAVITMRKYYSEEAETKWGVLGIKIEIYDLDKALAEQKSYVDNLYER